MTRTSPIPLRFEAGIQQELQLALSDDQSELPTGAQLSALRQRLAERTGSPVTSEHAERDSRVSASALDDEPRRPSGAPERRRFGSGRAPRLYAERSTRARRLVRVGVILGCVLVAAVAAAASYWAVTRTKPSGSPATGATSLQQVGKRGASGSPSTSPALVASAQSPVSESDGGTPPLPAPPKAIAEGPSELELLHEARRLQQTDPAAALRAVARQIRLFPRGVLAQEREVVAIEALLRLGRNEEARARGTAFLRLYPESMHARQVQKLVASSASKTSAPPAAAGATGATRSFSY